MGFKTRKDMCTSPAPSIQWVTNLPEANLQSSFLSYCIVTWKKYQQKNKIITMFSHTYLTKIQCLKIFKNKWIQKWNLWPILQTAQHFFLDKLIQLPSLTKWTLISAFYDLLSHTKLFFKYFKQKYACIYLNVTKGTDAVYIVKSNRIPLTPNPTFLLHFLSLLVYPDISNMFMQLFSGFSTSCYPLYPLLSFSQTFILFLLITSMDRTCATCSVQEEQDRDVEMSHDTSKK